MIKIEIKEFPQDFFQRRIEALASGEWVQGPAREFHQKFLQTTAEHFEMLKFGGSHRGVEWPDFSPFSFGTKRPSGEIIEDDGFEGTYTQRLTHKRSGGSWLLFDTGRLSREAGAGFAATSKSGVEFSTNLDYAKVHNEGGWTSFKMRDGSTRQAKVPARPFQFFTGDDIEDLRGFTLAWLDNL